MLVKTKCCMRDHMRVKQCVCFQIISLNRSCTHLLRSYLSLETSCTTLYVDGCTSVWVRPHRRRMWTCHRWVEDRDGLGLKDQQIFIRHIIFTIVYYHTVIKLYKLLFPAIQQRFTRYSEDKKVTQMAQRLKVGLHDIEKKLHCIIFFFCDICCDMKTISPGHLNCSICYSSRIIGVIL